ncbi:hypothetical protein LCGC14_1332020 [marine sediment metagenome]|uniref:Uncharacterized protein n=1 Tax=marine sediment metagenome TaxID=412755 RepID=A0A0F9KG57_9ZZZZ
MATLLKHHYTDCPEHGELTDYSRLDKEPPKHEWCWRLSHGPGSSIYGTSLQYACGIHISYVRSERVTI